MGDTVVQYLFVLESAPSNARSTLAGLQPLQDEGGVNVESDLRRGEVTRVDLTSLSKRRKSIHEKNAGPTGNVLMISIPSTL